MCGAEVIYIQRGDMGSSKTLILIDGHALAFRQYYALERTGMKTSDGTPTWGVYGFFKAIFDLLKHTELRPDAIAVAFDVSRKTFRFEKYPEYKSNRVAMPDPMRVQLGLIQEGLKAFNIPIYTKEGFEADDVIGTISREACELGHKVLILTGDQDAFQLVDKLGCTKVILPSKGELIEYNWDKIYEKLGVYPDQVIDYKALRGDTSDCIPGIKGIGEKTATMLLDRYYTLEKLLADCENIPEKSVKEKICNGKECANLSKFLATIVTDVDVDFDFEKTHIELPELADVTEFLKKMQFHSFIRNINSIMESFDKDYNPQKAAESSSKAIVEKPNINPQGQLQLGFFAEAAKKEINKGEESYDQKLITDSQDFEQLVEELEKQSLIAIRLKADIKSSVNSRLIGVAIGFNEALEADGRIKYSNDAAKNKTFYIPLAHSTLTNQLPSSAVLEALKPILEDKNIKKIAYDMKTEDNVFRNLGITIQGMVFDPMLASYVKDSSRNHGLENQAMDNLEHVISEFAAYEADKKKRIAFEDALIDNALNNATDEVSTILNLTKFWIKNLDNKELDLVYNIECPLALVLAEMEYTGVSIDTNYLKELTHSMDKTLKDVEGKIYEAAGETFNINSPKQVGEVLFDKMGLKSKKKRGKTQYSTSSDILEELAQEHEIARMILEYRKFAKLKSTYTEALPALIDATDDRIHTSYNQTVTTTGRLSSSNPNLQNIPIRTPEGSKIRQAFVPKDREKALILSADYSQIELRLLAHISGDENLKEAFLTGVDVHTLTASKVFGVKVEDVTREMRSKSKAVNFGIIYGQGRYGLAKSIGISPEEAQIFIDKYFATYPKIKTYMEGTIKEVEQKGFVETIFGRKRYLASELMSSNNMVREFAKRAAINQPIQGTAADIMKMAMIEFERKLNENKLKSKMIMQVHDEIVVELDRDEQNKVKELITESMQLGQRLSVPLEIDINVGATWEK